MSTNLRSILAKNLRQLIEADARVGVRSSVNAWARSKGLDVRMIDRLVKAENSPTLDTLDQIAKACGLEAWQLLAIDFVAPRPGEPSPAPKLALNDKQRELLELIHDLLNK